MHVRKDNSQKKNEYIGNNFLKCAFFVTNFCYATSIRQRQLKRNRDTTNYMDAESFKNNFLPYHRKLYCVAYRLLENEADAEDLVQEAYLKLWDKRDGLTLISNPEAFSVTLVKNMCFDLLRSSKYAISRKTVELTAVQDVSQTDNLEEQEVVRQIKDIITRLPKQQQQIVDLRDIKDCSYEEIEQITGLNATNIRVVLSRARKKIREEFNKWNNYGS